MKSASQKQITVGDLIRALNSLRTRTGDGALSHNVKQGRFQLCRVTYQGSKSTVTPITGYQDAAAHLASIEGYAA